jgi:peptidoglycan-associated lipoprotein
VKRIEMKDRSSRRRILKSFATVAALSSVMMLGACHKKTAPAPPPPPPPAPSPTASISVNPDTIQAGGAATLTWQTSNATDVSIDGIGAVQPSGSQQVNPSDSMTYHLTAKGPGGTQDATTRLTVTLAPAPQATTTSSASEAELFAQNIKDVYFDYDKASVRGDQSAAIQADAQFLAQHSGINITIEGHCDERGSTEYNLALGDSRASAVKDALVSAGVSSSRIKTISYGKEKPFCMESNESCYQQNRRGHLVYQR